MSVFWHETRGEEYLEPTTPVISNSNYLRAIYFFKKSSRAKFQVYSFFTYTLKTEDKMKAKKHTKSIYLNDLLYYEITFIIITISKIIYKNINKVVIYFIYYYYIIIFEKYNEH